MITYAGLGIAAVLSIGGWLTAQQRERTTGRSLRPLVRLGAALAATGLLLAVLTLPPTLPPTTYALALLAVLAAGLILIRGAATQAVGWTAWAEAATTGAGLAWSRPGRAVWALLATMGGLWLAGLLVSRGEPLAGLLGTGLALAPVRWWLVAGWKRESMRTGCERALAGMLAGGEEWDSREADQRGAPLKLRFDREQVPERIVAPLPPTWSVKRTEELEAEVHGRLRRISAHWIVEPDAFHRLLWIGKSEPLPTTVEYAAQYGDRRTICLGSARVSRAAEVAKVGRFGATFDLSWDLKRAPHGLIVGLTGAGKSAAAYVTIVTWCRAGNDVILCDPKRVEFTPLRGRKGVRRVETELEGIVAALEAAVQIMEDQYAAMATAGVRSVFKLSEGNRPTPLLVAVDEVFELLARRGGNDDQTKEINALKARAASAISSIGALGRAADVHLLLCCQRADRAVVEGPLQNNISFKLLCDPAQADPTERHMIGLQNLDVTFSTPGRAVAKSQGVPECELQVLWLDDDDIDKWLPVVDEAAAVRPVTARKPGQPSPLVPADEADGEIEVPEPMPEEEAWRKAELAAAEKRGKQDPNGEQKDRESETGPISRLAEAMPLKPDNPGESTPNLGYDPMEDFEE